MDNLLNYKNESEQVNNLTYTDYFYRLSLLARAIFKWSNLPNGMDEKWIEKKLFSSGSCLFFFDKELGYMVTDYTQSGSLNPHDEPTTLLPHATNFYTPEEKENNVDCVIIRNNDDCIPTLYSIKLFAIRLTEISRTIDINVHAQKTPVLILCSEKQRLTLKQIYKKWDGNEPVIFGDKNLDMSNIQVLKTDAPMVFPELQLQKHAIWNECMTFLGIKNANQDKRERLVTDEVSANDEQIEMSAHLMLKARQRAVEQINEIFDLQIKVEMRSKEELQTVLNEVKEGE